MSRESRTGAEACGDADTRTDQANRFDRARVARATATFEDYTELVADLIREQGEARVTDVARRLGVTLPTANKSLARLKREGLVVSRPYRGLFLTDKGAAMAERVRLRHRIVVDLLIAVGVPPDAAELDAEGIEHHVSEMTLAAFRAYLAHTEQASPARNSPNAAG